MKRHKAAKARTVAHHHKHVKPAHAHHKAATGHAQKHHKAAKHHAVAKKHKGTVHRGLAPAADQVASCAAEALAVSLRLAGAPVTDEDILALYWHTADDPDAGASIEATLEAAARFGLVGIRPVVFREQLLEQVAFLGANQETMPFDEALHGLILGVDLPGPHTVLSTPDGWWSWGELYCPWCEWPDAVVEEAWAVSWS